MFKIRKYKPSDLPEIAELFYNTVHSVNAGDYTREQLNAWADGNIDMEKWNREFTEHYTLVAEAGGVIVCFGDMDDSGYLDRLYVHADFQGMGIATAICDALEKTVNGRIKTHASITARPFFEKRGYKVVREQEVIRKGVKLKNYIMERINYENQRD